MARDPVRSPNYAIFFALCIYAHPFENAETGAGISSTAAQTSSLNGTIVNSGANQTSSQIPTPTASSDAPGGNTGGGNDSAIPTGTSLPGAVGGSIGGLLICSLLVWWVLSRRKRKKRQMLASKASSGHQPPEKRPEKRPVTEATKAPAVSSDTSDTTGATDRTQERLRAMHNPSRS